MAKIQLMIDADDAADLITTVRELGGLFDQNERVSMGIDDVESYPVPVSASQDAEKTAPKSRGRPKKDQVSTGAAALGVGDAFSNQIRDEIPAEIPANPFKPAPAEPPHSNPSDVTMLDVQAMAQAFIKADGNSMKKAQDLLSANFKDVDGQPVKMFSKLQGKDYADALELLRVEI
jgi:hypothetical protein